jgi:Holliday junction DNA helicase RuvA
MIDYVEGILTYKSPTYVVIDVQGLGYQLNISLHTYEKVMNLDRTRLFAHQVIKEDAHQLYGFADHDERTLFRQLISISGVGPNTARMMLSSLSPSELSQAIIRGDLALIKSIKGIGPKSAQRIIIELQDVLKKTGAEEVAAISDKTRIIDEALAAMVMLGFQKNMAEKAIAKIIREHNGQLTIEELIKQALKSL